MFREPPSTYTKLLVLISHVARPPQWISMDCSKRAGLTAVKSVHPLILSFIGEGKKIECFIKR
jgi:hypothetical protein